MCRSIVTKMRGNVGSQQGCSVGQNELEWDIGLIWPVKGIAMRKRVYVETTIPSFYFEPRLEPEMVVQREWTREWWDNQRQHYELVTSAPVIEELEEGDYPQKADALRLISELPLLSVDDQVLEVIDIYVQRHVMPRDPRGDAMHLALASCHNCHFLLTWNCATWQTPISSSTFGTSTRYSGCSCPRWLRRWSCPCGERRKHYETKPTH